MCLVVRGGGGWGRLCLQPTGGCHIGSLYTRWLLVSTNHCPGHRAYAPMVTQLWYTPICILSTRKPHRAHTQQTAKKYDHGRNIYVTCGYSSSDMTGMNVRVGANYIISQAWAVRFQQPDSTWLYCLNLCLSSPLIPAEKMFPASNKCCCPGLLNNQFHLK